MGDGVPVVEVHGAIRGWVCRHAGRIRVLTDLATVGPRARSIIYATCVAGVDADRHGEEVGPALAQAAGHYDAQTCDARGATSEAVTQAVGVFAGGDAIAEALATKGTAARRVVPELHSQRQAPPGTALHDILGRIPSGGQSLHY